MLKENWPRALDGSKDWTPGIGLVTVLISLAILLVSCSAATGVDYCGPWKPLRPSVEDVLSDGFARQVLTHNITGEQLRCWEAPNAH